MRTVSASLSDLSEVEGAFVLLRGADTSDQFQFIGVSNTQATAPDEFVLKEVVTAIISFLKTAFKTTFKTVFKDVAIVVKNACHKDTPIVGSVQLEKVLGDTIASVENAFCRGMGTINVIMHDLHRNGDGALIPGEMPPDDFSSEGKGTFFANKCAKYLAILVRKEVPGAHLAHSRDYDLKNCEVSYYDGGVIVRQNPSCATIYFARTMK